MEKNQKEGMISCYIWVIDTDKYPFNNFISYHMVRVCITYHFKNIYLVYHTGCTPIISLRSVLRRWFFFLFAQFWPRSTQRTSAWHLFDGCHGSCSKIILYLYRLVIFFGACAVVLLDIVALKWQLLVVLKKLWNKHWK